MVIAIACSGVLPLDKRSVSRCATVSVSVSVVNLWPALPSSSRSSWKFSMMPLCTTATLSVACGWALFSLGRPWVAQRVWPMPVAPLSGCFASSVSRLVILPSARRRSIRPSTRVAMPVES